MIVKERVYTENNNIIPSYQLAADSFDVNGTAGRNFVITLLQKGSCFFETNGEQFVAAAPAMILVSEDTVLRCSDSCEYICSSICFHPSFINMSLDFDIIRYGRDQLNLTDRQDSLLFQAFGDNPGSFETIHLNSMQYRECCSYFERFAGALEDMEESCWPCSAREVLLTFLIYLKGLDRNGRKTLSIQVPGNEPKIREIILYLYTHYSEELTINSIAGEFGTNRTTLNMRFKQATGCTVMRLLRNIRMDMAARLLRGSCMTVSEISYEAGFQDISNFGKLFRSTFGCTPSSYRNMYSSSAEMHQ